MKTKLALMIMTVAMVGFTQNVDAQAHKKQKKLEDKAAKMNKKGANMVVGIGVSERVDLGERKAVMSGKQQISESYKDYVKASTEDFRSETGVGPGSEINDDFENFVESVSLRLVEGARIHSSDSYRSKSNRKNGTHTYLVLYGIDPLTLENMMDEEMNKRGSDDVLYQKYMKSDYKKEHEKKVEEFMKLFEGEIND